MLGFAEALFGSSSASPPSAQDAPPPLNSTYPIWPAAANDDDFALLYHPDAPPEGAPLGFMEAAGQSTAPYADDEADYDVDDQDREAQKSANRWTLFLVVVLIAAALAALMAQLSGQAIWLR